MSVIKFDGVINFSRWQIKMNTILIQSGLNKKALTAIQLYMADEVLDKFSMKKHHSHCGSDSGPLSEEVVGESVDFEAATFSSMHV